MKYWDQKTAQLGWLMTDEMNSEGQGTHAQHEVLAMAWNMGFRFGVSRIGADAERVAGEVIAEFHKTEGPYIQKLLDELRPALPHKSTAQNAKEPGGVNEI